MSRCQTPSQTVGPFFRPSLIRPGLDLLINPKTRGERIVIEGRVLDGDGAPVDDAMVEIWQANADGRYDHPEDTQEKRLDPNFHGFGRAATNADGWFRFRTIKPGAVPAHDDRDHEFATVHALPIVSVIQPQSGAGDRKSVV